MDGLTADACAAMPKGVNPIGKITRLHNQIFSENIAGSNVATRHAVGFVHSIEKHGFLDDGRAGSILRFPDSEGLRPTPDRVRETLFNWLGQELDGQHCLGDLFAGGWS